MESDFFTSKFGGAKPKPWQRRTKYLSLLDLIYDLRIAGAVRRAARAASQTPRQKILLAAVQVPGREADLARVIDAFTAPNSHALTVSLVPMGNRGKFDNINIAFSGHDLSHFDWVLIVDDDIAIPRNFLDLFFYFCWRHDLRIAQPGHRLSSYVSYALTERHWASTVRRTNFVEIGPVTAIHSSLFDRLIPFPHLRYGWGLDVLWADRALREAWRLGIVDATPIRHLRPVGVSYDTKAAIAEAEDFLRSHAATSLRADIFGTNVKL